MARLTSRAGESEGELCYLCGSLEATTRDHVFPESLFQPPRPTNLITLPACEDCNAALSLDEEYFRVFVAGSSYGCDVGRAIWEGPVLRRLRRPESQAFRRMMAANIGEAHLSSPGGICLGSVPTLSGDTKRINRVLAKIVRGLHVYHGGNRLEHYVSIHFDYISSAGHGPVDPAVRAAIMQTPKFQLGSEVMYRFGATAEDPRLSITLVGFYERAFFVIATSPHEPEPSETATATLP